MIKLVWILRRCRVGLITSLTFGLLLSGCSASAPDYGRLLDEGYLVPLEQKFSVQVSRTCHLAGDTNSRSWNMEFRATVAADPSQVAEVLKQAGRVTRTHRDPIVLQQFPGEPQKGWNGAVGPADAKVSSGARMSSIGLTFNGADSTRRPDRLLGWRETCPPS